jgi:hypothetical protein
MNPAWFEIPAVVIILMFVCIVVIRAFTAPVSRSEDSVDIFMRLHLPSDASPSGRASPQRRSDYFGARSTRKRNRR